MQTDEIKQLFGITTSESTGLLLLKKRNFEEFLKVVDEKAFIRFQERLLLLYPDDASDVPKWVKHCIKRLGTNQKAFCTDLKLSVSEHQFSRYLSGQSKLSSDDEKVVITTLILKLQELNLI